MDLMGGLKIRYDAALQSNSDSEFYENVHKYIDFIVKTPALAKIINDTEKQYRKTNIKILDSKTEDANARLRSEQISKLERYNLYTAHYLTLYIKIYFPLEDYMTTDEFDEDQDPVALIMLKGLKNVLRRGYHKNPKNYFKWSKEGLKSYAKAYEGERSYYKNELRKFHIQFIPEVEKITDEPEKAESQEKIKIFIDDSLGIYRVVKNKKLNYPIRRGSKRFVIIKNLSRELAKLSKLEELTKQRPGIIMQEISRTNKAFRQKLKLTEDLIIRHDTSGYSLNKIYEYSLDNME